MHRKTIGPGHGSRQVYDDRACACWELCERNGCVTIDSLSEHAGISRHQARQHLSNAAYRGDLVRVELGVYVLPGASMGLSVHLAAEAN